MLHQQLKEKTSPAHQALEKEMVLLIREIRSTEGYASFLTILYGYYSAMERALEPFLIARPEISFDGRRKAKRILDDLDHLDSNKPLLSCQDIPTIHSYESALGAMYVLEGSVLGGKFIAKMISTQLGLSEGNALTFFSGYGEETASMWKSFCLNLQAPFDDAVRDEIVNAANDTFSTFKHWIEKNATAS